MGMQSSNLILHFYCMLPIHVQVVYTCTTIITPVLCWCLFDRYGLQDFVTITPSDNEGAVLGESKVKSLLSSVNIALSDAGW